MTKVFEPESRARTTVFEPLPPASQLSSFINSQTTIDDVISRFSSAELERMLREEVSGMSEPTKRRLLKQAGSLKAFLQLVLKQTVARMITQELVNRYGPAVLGALGLGATATAAAAATDVFSNLTPDQLEVFRPLYEGSPLLQQMGSLPSAVDPTMLPAPEIPDVSAVTDDTTGLLEWLSALFS